MAVSVDPHRPLPPLKGDQARASDPGVHVWLSASAGTGKTQVLAARVFRLLLKGTDPAAILCLTFTKAGAAEMTQRIAARLAAWVRMPGPMLARDLDALGERPTPALQARARTLFAKVLDAPGGGVRIQTIHGFCQGLLAAFPLEAGIVPGFRPLEPREEALLARETLAGMLAEAEAQGRTRPVETIGRLSVRLGEGGAESFLLDCARAGPALEALPSGIQPWLRGALGLPLGDIDEALTQGCSGIDEAVVRRIAAANAAWGTASGSKQADTIAAWLAADIAGRVATIETLGGVVLTGKGEARKASRKLIDAEPDYETLAAMLGDACRDLASLAVRAAYADLLADALIVGRDYARAYAAAKRRSGAVDFDDLIATTVALLEQPGIGEWVRFKLDQATEHVLIDEAQDTNLNQWRIVQALAAEFFVGRGIYAPSTRTLFTVGDYKQAIYGFQGTDPVNFAWAERHFAGQAASVAGDDDTPPEDRGLPFEQLALTHSFRSTRAVLAFVDAAIEAVPPPGLGEIATIDAHASEVPGPGTVTLWPPVIAGGSDEDEEDWIDDAVRRLASDIARAIKRWLDDGLMLESKGRALRPEDVMILVKRRGDLASLIVARLYAEGVPVAGVDRLRLNAPLAVQDLLAAIRFVLQPDDDLSLASLLVSPLIGWTQDELMAAAPRAGGRLWRHLRDTQPADRLAPLRAMLARADIATPYRFLEELLSGPLDGRRKLVHRLGAEARDPIEELLAAALDFEVATTPSLQRFLDWFDRGDVDIVRDPSQPDGAVRVMTAHGAKGLQAPLVILADATVDPTKSPRSVLRWAPEAGAAPIPIFRPRAAERGGPLDDVMTATEARELAEHWRLFYVAATRAEERLVIAGSLGPSAKGVPPVASWYAVADRALTALGVEGAGERVFTGIDRQEPVPLEDRKAVPADAAATLPEWVRRAPPVDPRPARPLTPSSLGEDAVADPPPTPALQAAAERGRLIHALFEQLPPVAPDARRAAADRWMRDAGGVAQEAARAAIVDRVLAVIDDPRIAALFAPDALAEVPIAATLADGLVVSGTVDRLLVTPDLVRVVDFKTGRRVPAGLADIPDFHLRQIAAYVAALAVIFPGRRIDAALVYTAGPTFLALPPDLLAAHKPGFPSREQRLADGA